MSLYDSLTTSNGTSINLHRVAAISGGIIAGAFFGSMATFVSSIFHVMFIDPVQGFTSFLTRKGGRVTLGIIPYFFHLLTVGSHKIWAPVNSFLRDTGVLAFLIALAFAITLGFIAAYTQRWAT